jgi:hypothetical protein
MNKVTYTRKATPLKASSTSGLFSVIVALQTLVGFFVLFLMGIFTDDFNAFRKVRCVMVLYP